MYPLNPYRVSKENLKRNTYNLPRPPILSIPPPKPIPNITMQIREEPKPIPTPPIIPIQPIEKPISSNETSIQPIEKPIPSNLLSSDILNEESARIQPVQNIRIQLKDHQRALVRRCLNIEKLYIDKQNENYGIMSDIPGAGKTYVVLSLIWFIKQYYEKFNIPKKERHACLIVVPQNIISQWCDAIETFSLDFKYKIFTDFNDISQLQYSSDLLYEFDILITIPLYYHQIASSFQQQKYRINRLFFDEIDSISHLLKMTIPCDFVWFVSASFDPSYTGDYKIVKTDVPFHTAQCEVEFIHKNFILPNPKTTIYRIYNFIIDTLLPEFFQIPNPILQNIYQLNYQNAYVVSNGVSKQMMINYQYLNKKGNDEMEFVRFILQDDSQVLKQHPSMIQQIQERIGELKMKVPLEKNDAEYLQELERDYQQKRGQLIQSAKRIQQIHQLRQNYSLCTLCYKSYSNIHYKTPCCQEKICQSCYQQWSPRNRECMICLVPQMLKEYITEEREEVMNNFQQYMMEKIQNRARSFYSQIQDSKEELQMVTTNVSKIQQLEMWIRNEMKMDKKILFFCNQVQAFPVIKNLFQKYQYGVVELDGGNVMDIDAVISKYKKGDANVLLLSGDYATFGMNLEFTTDIVFMNKMDSEKEKQIIGRAQRPGRNDELRIFYLFYFFE